MADNPQVTIAIIEAFNACYELCGPFDDNWQELCLAAALRALADYHATTLNGSALCEWTPTPGTRQEMRNIAAELDNHADNPYNDYLLGQ